MPVEFKGLLGNDKLKTYFSDCIEDNVLPHAIILEGKKGSGRFSFALQLASAAMCVSENKPCGICKNCRQISKGEAPDVRVTELMSDKQFITVDAIREIRSDAPTVPCEGELKFYIIKDSDKMNVQAQNALLKILEEPPSFVVFILICENSSLLLPTVRSRAPVFRTQSFSDKELSTYLITLNDEAKKLKERDEEAFNRVIKVADGSIGMAISALDKKAYNKLTDKRDTVLSMLEALVGVEKSVFYSFEDELPSKRDELSSLIADLKSAFRDILLRKKSMGVNYLYFSSDEEVQRFSSVMTAGRLLDAIDCCDKALRSNEMNANVNLMKINFICALWKCVH